MMAVFSKASSVNSPTRASDRGGNNKKQKDLPIGAIQEFSSFSLQKLRKRQSALGSRYQSTCISKHYEVNHQIYEAFQFHYYNLSSVVVVDASNNNNNNNHTQPQPQPQPQETTNAAKSNFEWISFAFCLGWNFVETALLELPNHGYFYSNQDPDLVKLRKRSSLAALEVARLLQRIIKLMDSLDMGNVPEETMLLNNDNNHDPNAVWLLHDNREECKRRLVTLKYLAKEQQCEERLDAYEATRKSILSKWRNNGGSVPSRFEYDDERSAENGATTSIRFMAGNHRGGRLSPPQPPSYDDQDEASHRKNTNNPVVDCDNVGENFLKCSRLFCPSALSERTDSYTIPLRATRTTRPSSALADEEQDYNYNDDDDSDNRSDSAIFHSVSNSRPFGINNNNYNTDGLMILQNNNSDDAVFESPIKSNDSQGSLISPPEATTIPTTRNETEDSSIDSSSRISRGKLKKIKKQNHSKNKNNGDETPTKKVNKSYPAWLFGKKSNDLQQQQQQRDREDTDLEEALYQSQLEAAKAASMREEDLLGDLIHGISNSNSNSFDQQRELYSSFSSWSATGHPQVAATTTAPAPQAIKTTTDAQHNYDLKRALYLSGLQIDETTTRHQHHDGGTSRNPSLHQRSFEIDSCCERGKRDDSAREGPASSMPVSIRQGAVTKGTTGGVPTVVVVKGVPVAPVVVKGVPVAMAPPPPPGAIHRRRNGTDPYSLLRVLRGCCRKDFERLRDNKKVVVTRVSTYQGRIKGSTNGCTVIAPLLCVHHFQTRNHLPQNNNIGASSPAAAPSRRLSDGTIASVIDTESPSLLPDIRNSLGVSKNAFLIPHDAHEALIESKHMSRDQFVTVCGGNILEEGHLDALVRELSKVLPDGKRLGATFFFHQHVIAILQLRGCSNDSQADSDSNKKGTTSRTSTSVSFDVIDSLPNKATLPLPPISSSPISSDAHPRPPNCARIFCEDTASLKTTLKWYACSVFTPENQRYIDDYQWDEKLTDFDPRVFQAFLWKEA